MGRCLTNVINSVEKVPVEYVRDDVFNRENFKRCIDRFQLRKGGGRVVVCAPALSHRIADFPSKIIKIFIIVIMVIVLSLYRKKKIETEGRPDIWEARELEKYMGRLG